MEATRRAAPRAAAPRAAAPPPPSGAAPNLPDRSYTALALRQRQAHEQAEVAGRAGAAGLGAGSSPAPRALSSTKSRTPWRSHASRIGRARLDRVHEVDAGLREHARTSAHLGRARRSRSGARRRPTARAARRLRVALHGVERLAGEGGHEGARGAGDRGRAQAVHRLLRPLDGDQGVDGGQAADGGVGSRGGAGTRRCGNGAGSWDGTSRHGSECARWRRAAAWHGAEADPARRSPAASQAMRGCSHRGGPFEQHRRSLATPARAKPGRHGRKGRVPSLLCPESGLVGLAARAMASTRPVAAARPDEIAVPARNC